MAPPTSTDGANTGAFVPPTTVATGETAPAPPRRCPNCGTAAEDAYCPHCGQEQVELHRSLRAHADDLFDALAGWDGKIPRTLWALVRHPGLLTAEFLAGRRARWVRPLKLYLWLSVLFFLVQSVGGDDAREGSPRDGIRFTGNTRGDSVVLSDAAAIDSMVSSGALGARAADSTDHSLTAQVQRRFAGRLRTLAQMPAERRSRAFREAFLANVGRMVFVLLPAFALLLRMLYARGPWYFAEHLVFALHMHAFAMVAMTLVALLPDGWDAIPVFWIPAALFVAMRRVYGQSRGRTTVKFAALLASYLVVSSLAMTATVALTVLFLDA